MSGRAERLDATRTYRIFSVYMGFRQDRCLGPQIPPNSIVTKVWVLGVYNNVGAHLQGLAAQAWANPSPGEKPYKPRKYSTTKTANFLYYAGAYNRRE